MSVEVLFTLVDSDAPVPSYAHPGDAGLDLTTRQACALEPGERALLPTGIAIAMPAGYAAFVHPRSGLAVKHGVTDQTIRNDKDWLVDNGHFLNSDQWVITDLGMALLAG